jgi:MSHA biogenesis protein MshN
MSLINKMLKDLDARGTTRAEGVPPEIRTVTGERRRLPVGRIAAVTAAVLVLAGGATAWFLFPRKGYTYQEQPAPVPAQVAQAPVAPADPAPVTVAEVAPPPALPENPTPAPAPEPVPEPAAPARDKPAAPAAARKETPEPVRAAPAEGPRQGAPLAAAPLAAAAPPAAEGSVTSWAVANARARAEEARLAKRWKAAAARLAALPPAERRAGERKLREEQARAAERARTEAVWLAALKRREAAGGAIPNDAPAVVRGPGAGAGQGRVETNSQSAENAYRRALTSLQDGRVGEAIAGLQQTLRTSPRHEAARQTLVSLLIENNRGDEAMIQLQQALTLEHRQPALAMLLARLQIERGKSGIEALQRTLPYAAAAGNGEYHAFLGGALQRQGRLREAAEQYETALRTAPNNAVWWMGLGIALQGERRNAEAAHAFRQAKALGTLSPELQAFVERRLQQVGR